MKFGLLKTALVGLAIVLGAGSAGAQTSLEAVKESGTLKIGWGEWKPFEYKDVISGELKGVMIDLAAEVAKRMDLKPEFVLDAWPTMPAGIAAGRFSVALMGYSDGRAKVVDFSHPLYTSDFTGMVKKTSGITSWSQLNQPGRTIAVTTGSSTDELLSELAKKGEIKCDVQRIRDVGSAVLALQSGNVDGYVNQRDSLSLMAAQQPQMAVIDGSFGKAWFGVVFPKGDKAFADDVNKAVDSMIADHFIAHTIAKYGIKGSVEAE